MLPRLWSYLISGYFRIFSLSLGAFIAVLIVSRFRDIARFTALSGSWMQTLFFTAYQIPSILPLALPISALIASFLLLERLSISGELTACRAAGKSLFSLLFPLWICAALLFCLAFLTAAEATPFCRRETKRLLVEKTSTNPLLLLQRQTLIRLKNAYLHMDMKEGEKEAHNLLFFFYNASHERLSLVRAKKAALENTTLLFQNVAIVSHLPSGSPSFFDPLVIENQETMRTSAPKLSRALRKKNPKLEPASLRFKELSLYGEQKEARCKQAAQREKLRRIFLSLAVLSFTILGSSFGVQIGRSEKKSWIAPCLLALSSLLFYLLSKGLRAEAPLFLAILAFPLCLNLALSLHRLSTLEKGGT